MEERTEKAKIRQKHHWETKNRQTLKNKEQIKTS